MIYPSHVVGALMELLPNNIAWRLAELRRVSRSHNHLVCGPPTLRRSTSPSSMHLCPSLVSISGALVPLCSRVDDLEVGADNEAPSVDGMELETDGEDRVPPRKAHHGHNKGAYPTV